MKRYTVIFSNMDASTQTPHTPQTIQTVYGYSLEIHCMDDYKLYERVKISPIYINQDKFLEYTNREIQEIIQDTGQDSKEFIYPLTKEFLDSINLFEEINNRSNDIDIMDSSLTRIVVMKRKIVY